MISSCLIFKMRTRKYIVAEKSIVQTWRTFFLYFSDRVDVGFFLGSLYSKLSNFLFNPEGGLDAKRVQIRLINCFYEKIIIFLGRIADYFCFGLQ